jgi:hypothetical protein
MDARLVWTNDEGGEGGPVTTVGFSTTLSEADRRILAAWAVKCAQRVLGLFEAEAPDDAGPRDAIARARGLDPGFSRPAFSPRSSVRSRSVWRIPATCSPPSGERMVAAR